MSHDYDAIVIGSGFGGAVAACRLSQAGLRVAILERGRRYDTPNAFPRSWNDPLDGWLWHHEQGLFDVKAIPEMVVVQSAGYGGGSLIYANVHLRPMSDVFEQGWPAGYSREALDPYFDLVAYMLDIRPITEAPAGLPAKTEMVTRALTQLGRKEQVCYPNLAVDFGAPGMKHRNKFDVQQAGCTYCGECDIGCAIGAKNTLDRNYLAVAERAGAVVTTRCEAKQISVVENDGYAVGYRDHADGSDKVLSASVVVLCAGAVNSTELLLRCRDDYRTLPNLSAALGLGYSGNGDFLGFDFDTVSPGSPSTGPTITTAVVYDTGRGAQRSWFTLQDGGFPKQVGALLQLLRPESSWLRGANILLREDMRQALHQKSAELIGSEDPLASRSGVFLAMGRDDAQGVLSLHAITRDLHITWNLADNLPLYGAESRLIDDVVREMGGTPGYNPLWESLHQPISVHNLGGCRMSDDRATGVTDGRGEVHGYPGLFVLDGAILPSSTGVNPSHTIAAVAERNIEWLIQRLQQTDTWQAPERAKASRIIEPMDNITIPKGGTAPTRKLPIGLLFSETMKGFLAPMTLEPGTLADYTAAAKAAESAGQKAAFTLTITIADLDRFLIDPAHMGQAVGNVVAVPITPSAGASVSAGVFNLFERDGQLYERKMLYGLPFVGADGKDYRLDGFKEVKDHGDFDVWGSTSTLYTVVRAGHASDGPVVAGGILHIHLPDFMHQLTTFRALNAANALESAETLLTFGKMFLGSLWAVFGGSKIGEGDAAST